MKLAAASPTPSTQGAPGMPCMKKRVLPDTTTAKTKVVWPPKKETFASETVAG